MNPTGSEVLAKFCWRRFVAHLVGEAALEAIRDAAMNALGQIERPQEQHSMRWKCNECENIKQFTKPVSLGLESAVHPSGKLA
jgi:hypothetical protein